SRGGPMQYTRPVTSPSGDLSARPPSGPWASDLAPVLYARFADGVARLGRFAPLVATLGKSYAGEERRLLYLMVRHAAPEFVFELSPKRGWSTLHIAAALEDNGRGKVISFELDPIYGHLARSTVRRAGLGHRSEIVVGDVREKLPRVYERLRRDGQVSGIGFLFIDSEHSAPFATWYLENLFPLVVRGGLIHVHDIEAAPERVVPGAAASHEPLGEERVLAEHLIAHREAYRWWSVAAAVRDAAYLERVRPWGGGRLELLRGDGAEPVPLRRVHADRGDGARPLQRPRGHHVRHRAAGALARADLDGAQRLGVRGGLRRARSARARRHRARDRLRRGRA